MELPPAAPRPSWLASRAALWVAVLVPAAVLCGFAWLLPKEVFWITDGGNRFIQVQSFERQAPPQIVYPARHLDPELRFFPWSGHHFQAVGGRIVSYYLPYFALLSVPGYRVAGAAGLYLLPLAAAIAVLALFPWLLAEAGLGAAARAPATLALGLATPLLFYGMTFWEHSLAVLTALAAVVLLLRAGRLERGREALMAGLFLALSTVLREEGYVLALALLLAFLWTFRAPRLGAILAGEWIAVMAPVWWLQHRWFGAALGIHAAAYSGLAAAGPGGGGLAGDGGLAGVGRALGAKLGDFAFFLLRFHPDPWVSGLLGAPFILVLLAGLRRRPGQPGRTGALDLCLLGAAAAAAGMLAWQLAGEPRGVFDTLYTQGLLPHTPFLLLALLGLRAQLASPDRAARFLACACVLFSVLVVIPLNRADVGIIWGPRHYLDVYPLLAAVSLLALRDLWRGAEGPVRRRTLAALAGVLALLGLAVESQGLRLLALKKTGSERLLAAVRATPGRAVVVDAYWFAEELAALYGEREMLEVASDGAYRDVLDLLARGGYTEVTVVLSRRYGQLSPAAIADLRRRAVSGRLVFTPGLEFLEAAVVSVRLRQH
ncbi:MAG TPA: hypothetical protein VMW75_09085 [Thermoanaerobaculia bacterium]|nr:hypothetical protein [Thermoanaerobaculia bacterium]